jgi:CCR4-NOT transcription complex subunit 1
VQDNLDVACSAIEKAAMERAVIDIDEGFAPSYDIRRRHREVLLILSIILKDC